MQSKKQALTDGQMKSLLTALLLLEEETRAKVAEHKTQEKRSSDGWHSRSPTSVMAKRGELS